MTEEKQTLIEFPTDFSLKIMGAQHPDFLPEILKTIRQHAPDTSEANVKTRPSSSGNYIGATVTVRAESQEHLDGIYRAVTSHPMVKVVF
ncbi:YbeD family protein [Neisseria sp.]|uniref:YbeD family protein n=1 Tax=Neisseria sp. TaxID=192066 RepID=UPI0035A12AA9